VTVKVVTLNGTFEIDLTEMKVVRAGMRSPFPMTLRKVPSPVVGERMELDTEEGGQLSTEQVVEVTS